jgi:hypothetical protein
MGNHMVFVHGEDNLPGVSEHSRMENYMEAHFGVKKLVNLEMEQEPHSNQ